MHYYSPHKISISQSNFEKGERSMNTEAVPQTAIKWTDEYTDTKRLKILTAPQLNIPGLQLFGHQIRTFATESLPLHYHEGCYEVVYVCNGTPSFHVAEKNYTLCGGDAFITQPNQVHSTNSDPVTISEMYWFQINLDCCPNFLFQDQLSVDYLRNGLSALSSPRIITDTPIIEKLLHSAFQEALSCSKPQLVAQYLSLILYMMLECSEKTTFKLTPDIGRVTNYILDHIYETISLDELSAVAYLSTSQLKQKFKKQMGIAPRQFINAQKIECSKNLLQEGHSIHEVAAMLHFDNSSYFTTVFKRYNSCTPSEYIKKLRQGQNPDR